MANGNGNPAHIEGLEFVDTSDWKKDNDAIIKMGELRQTIADGKLDAALALAKKMQAKEQAKERAESKSLALELIEQAEPGKPPDWASIAGALNIEVEYHKPAPILRDFLENTSPDIPYFVDDLIMENAKCYLSSPPKSGKSF